MDKNFFNVRKDEDLQADYSPSGGASAFLIALLFICVSLFFFNLSVSLKERESGTPSKLEDALLAFADGLEENEAVCAFLGIEDELSEEEIH